MTGDIKGESASRDIVEGMYDATLYLLGLWLPRRESGRGRDEVHGQVGERSGIRAPLQVRLIAPNGAAAPYLLGAYAGSKKRVAVVPVPVI